MADRHPAVLHRHEFLEVGIVEGPSVDDLLAPGVDDPGLLAAAQAKRFALAGRYFDHIWPPLLRCHCEERSDEAISIG
jgi:hypothetical protein